jgi:MYST family zinc finger domain
MLFFKLNSGCLSNNWFFVILFFFIFLYHFFPLIFTCFERTMVLDVVFLWKFLFLLSSLADQTPALAPGVTQKDVDLYKTIRERAAAAVAEIMSAYTATEVQPSTSQAFVTPMKNPVASSSKSVGKAFHPSPTAAAVIAQERCPAAIEFGKHEITTWYSSPFPQEYAR